MTIGVVELPKQSYLISRRQCKLFILLLFTNDFLIFEPNKIASPFKSYLF